MHQLFDHFNHLKFEICSTGFNICLIPVTVFALYLTILLPQPIWTDVDKSEEFFGADSTSPSESRNPSSFLPKRVSLRTLRNQKSAKSFTTLPSFDFEVGLNFSSEYDLSISSSSESEVETQVNRY